MHQYGLYILLGLGLMGCNSAKQPEPTPAETPKNPEIKKQIDSLTLSEDEIKQRKEIIEKLRREDRIVAPLTHIQMQVLENHQISQDDVERSYLFRKSAFERCYKNALAATDGKFSGKASFRLKNIAGAEAPELSELSTDLPKEMETCLVDSTARWPVPSGADFKVQFEFSATPRSVDDLPATVPAHDHHHHHHPEEAPEIDNIPEEETIPALPADE